MRCATDSPGLLLMVASMVALLPICFSANSPPILAVGYGNLTNFCPAPLFGWNGYIFSAGGEAPVSIEKLDENLNVIGVPLTIPGATGDMYTATKDDNGFGYFAFRVSPGRVAKVNLDTMTQVGSLLTLTTNSPSASIVHNGFLYLGSFTSPAKISKVQLSTFTEVATLSLVSPENLLFLTAVKQGDNLYFATTMTPSRLIKVDTTNFSYTAINLSVNAPYAFVIWDGFLYIGDSTVPKVIKFDLANDIQVGNALNITGCGTIWAANVDQGYAYFNCNSAPTIITVDLEAFVQLTPDLGLADPPMKISAQSQVAVYNGYGYSASCDPRVARASSTIAKFGPLLSSTGTSSPSSSPSNAPSNAPSLAPSPSSATVAPTYGASALPSSSPTHAPGDPSQSPFYHWLGPGIAVVPETIVTTVGPVTFDSCYSACASFMYYTVYADTCTCSNGPQTRSQEGAQAFAICLGSALRVKSDARPKKARKGKILTVRLQLRNINGEQAFGGLILVVTMPTGVRYVTSEDKGLGKHDLQPNVEAGVVTWTVPFLGARKRARFNFKVLMATSVPSGSSFKFRIHTAQTGIEDAPYCVTPADPLMVLVK